MTLTGKTRYRINWRKKLILQVEYIMHYMDPIGGTGFYDEYSKKYWKDAKIEDIQELKGIV